MKAVTKAAHLPADQQAIIDRCFHPSGEWVELTVEWLESNLPERFEDQVTLHPNRVAVKVGTQQLTYIELNRAANQVAHTLLAQIGPDPEPIPIVFEPGVQFFIALWGVLKAGKFYVPIDITYPEERNKQILEDLDASFILTNRVNHPLAHSLHPTEGAILDIEATTNAPTINPSRPIPSDAYAYVVFTSGSTGRPKGVIVNHKDALNFSRVTGNRAHICPQDRMGFTSSLSFNGAASSIFTAHLHGAGLYPFDLKHLGSESITDWLTTEQITIFTIIPSAFRQWATTLPLGGNLPWVRYLRLGAEKMFVSDWELYRTRFTDRTILRFTYSSSEAKVITDFHMTTQSIFDENTIPIGYAVDSVDVLIVDEQHEVIPVGRVGEIAARSHYMSPGYWRRPDLTGAKFLTDPDDPKARIYLTGDLGMMRPDGRLTFLGRRDFQVKIRGHRVEVVEIESAFMEMGSLAEAVVLARADARGEDRLAAWLAPHTSPPPTVSEIRRHLAQSLPDYMIPQSFTFLRTLPKTAAGKVDRRALPAPDISRPHLDTTFVPPQTPLEIEVAQIWRKVLGIDSVGRDDDFFDLGGDSIRAMRILVRLQTLSPSPLHIQAIFDAPTVGQMSTYLVTHYLREEERVATEPAYAPGPAEAARVKQPVVTEIDSQTISRFSSLLAQQMVLDTGTGKSSSAPKNPSAIFILAPPRSGTTLLRVMLAGHPRLFALPELYLLNYSDLAQRRDANRGRTAYRLEGSVRAFMSLYNCPAAEAHERMFEYEQQGLSTRALYNIMQKDAGDRILVDKTPLYASHPEILHRAEEWFDAPLYIHLSRHPRGMINSYTSSNFHLRNELGTTFAAEQLAELTWLVYHQNIIDFLGRIPEHRQFHLRYEDLATTPDATMRRLCAFLGIDFDPALLTPYDDPQKRMTDGIYPESQMIGDPNFHQFSNVSAEPAVRWRTKQKSGKLSEYSRQIAHRFGYDGYPS